MSFYDKNRQLFSPQDNQSPYEEFNSRLDEHSSNIQRSPFKENAKMVLNNRNDYNEQMRLNESIEFTNKYNQNHQISNDMNNDLPKVPIVQSEQNKQIFNSMRRDRGHMKNLLYGKYYRKSDTSENTRNDKKSDAGRLAIKITQKNDSPLDCSQVSNDVPTRYENKLNVNTKKRIYGMAYDKTNNNKMYSDNIFSIHSKRMQGRVVTKKIVNTEYSHDFGNSEIDVAAGFYRKPQNISENFNQNQQSDYDLTPIGNKSHINSKSLDRNSQLENSKQNLFNLRRVSRYSYRPVDHLSKVMSWKNCNENMISRHGLNEEKYPDHTEDQQESISRSNSKKSSNNSRHSYRPKDSNPIIAQQGRRDSYHYDMPSRQDINDYKMPKLHIQSNSYDGSIVNSVRKSLRPHDHRDLLKVDDYQYGTPSRDQLNQEKNGLIWNSRNELSSSRHSSRRKDNPYLLKDVNIENRMLNRNELTSEKNGSLKSNLNIVSSPARAFKPKDHTQLLKNPNVKNKMLSREDLYEEKSGRYHDPYDINFNKRRNSRPKDNHSLIKDVNFEDKMISRKDYLQDNKNYYLNEANMLNNDNIQINNTPNNQKYNMDYEFDNIFSKEDMNKQIDQRRIQLEDQQPKNNFEPDLELNNLDKSLEIQDDNKIYREGEERPKSNVKFDDLKNRENLYNPKKYSYENSSSMNRQQIDLAREKANNDYYKKFDSEHKQDSREIEHSEDDEEINYEHFFRLFEGIVDLQQQKLGLGFTAELDKNRIFELARFQREMKNMRKNHIPFEEGEKMVWILKNVIFSKRYNNFLKKNSSNKPRIENFKQAIRRRVSNHFDLERRKKIKRQLTEELELRKLPVGVLKLEYTRLNAK